MKTFFSILLGLILLTGISVDGVNGQTTARTINIGVVNGKAVSLPKPDYPAQLRDAGIEGTVVVNIIINETGSVTSADAEIADQRIRKADDGTLLQPLILDPQLREAAEAAARQAKFSPNILNGEAAVVRGKIVYNFTAKSATDVASGTKVDSGGNVLNGKATFLPLPTYPAAAKAVKASGSVVVQVTLDEEGSVVSATAVSGHPLLRNASESAAYNAKFSPTLLSGQPVKVTGMLVYNFVP